MLFAVLGLLFLKGALYMGKDLKGKELGVGINQQKNGLYSARFVDKHGNRKQKRFKKLQECRQWLADASYIDEHSNIAQANDMMTDAWFEYFIEIKKKTVRPNTVRNYTERYETNIKPVIGKMLLSDIKPLHCQKIFLDMADEGYRTSTLYQTRITLFNLIQRYRKFLTYTSIFFIIFLQLALFIKYILNSWNFYCIFASNNQ